jgi:glucosamine-6-phosphate deaminase
MEIIICKDSNEVAQCAASIITNVIRLKPTSVLGLATGSTPVKLYKELIHRYEAGEVSFKKVVTFNLDEYVGIPSTNSQSYRYFMNTNLFKHIDIKITNTHLPDGNAKDPMKEGPAYERKIKKAKGVDLQVLGIGANGHVGFNEPTSSIGSRTRIKALTEQTIRDNSRFFGEGEHQPQLAITMGIQTILEAKRVILLATGASKAKAIATAAEGPMSAMCPASALQLHPHATFIIDEEAASQLTLQDYYKFVRNQQERLEQQKIETKMRRKR